MKDYKITYFMYPDKDIEISIKAENEEEAMTFAKSYRNDPYKVEETEEGEMTIRTLLTINYKNGNKLEELVNYVRFEDGAIFYTKDSQIQQSVTVPTRTPLEYVESFDIEKIACDGWERR